MTQPLGNCPGCGGDEPFEQVHSGWHADDQCPGAHGDGLDSECTEWVCSGCGAGVFMGTVIMGTSAGTEGGVLAAAGEGSAARARQSVRAA
jgi:hypothetical protein